MVYLTIQLLTAQLDSGQPMPRLKLLPHFHWYSDSRPQTIRFVW